eukprot:m.475475 g.475475  ORF g.475475 m.475475 type:complete len:812 (+) comp38530_c0_seq1:389-2824(+)
MRTGNDARQRMLLPLRACLLGLMCTAQIDAACEIPPVQGHVSIFTPDVGQDAFLNCVALVSVSIPNTVLNIESNAFRGTSLRAVAIPGSVVTIGIGAFSSCFNLTSLNLGLGVTNIGPSAFAHCPLDNLVLPSSLRAIGTDAFLNCPLGTISIPNSTQLAIQSSAFSGQNLCLAGLYVVGANLCNCTPCTFSPTIQPTPSLTLPPGGGLPPVGLPLARQPTGAPPTSLSPTRAPTSTAPTVTSNTPTVSPSTAAPVPSPTGIPTPLLLTAPPSSVPVSVTPSPPPTGVPTNDINSPCFITPQGSGHVAYPALSGVGPGQFFGCSALRSIDLSSTITFIGSQAFQQSGLTTITLPSQLQTLQGSAFRDCLDLSTVVLPAPIQLLGTFAFAGCVRLTTVTMAFDFSVITEGMFANCSSLVHIAVPSQLRSIGVGAFQGCTALSSLVIPPSVRTIFGRAFDGCTALRTFAIPPVNSSLVGISSTAFANCGCDLRLYVQNSTVCNCVPCPGQTFSPTTAITAAPLVAVTTAPASAAPTTGVPTARSPVPVSTSAPTSAPSPGTTPNPTSTPSSAAPTAAPTVPLTTTTSPSPITAPCDPVAQGAACRGTGSDESGGSSGNVLVVAVVVALLVVLALLGIFFVTVIRPGIVRRRAAAKLAKYRQESGQSVSAVVAAELGGNSSSTYASPAFHQPDHRSGSRGSTGSDNQRTYQHNNAVQRRSVALDKDDYVATSVAGVGSAQSHSQYATTAPLAFATYADASVGAYSKFKDPLQDARASNGIEPSLKGGVTLQELPAGEYHKFNDPVGERQPNTDA